MAIHFDNITDENVQADHTSTMPDNTSYPAIPNELSCAARLKDGDRLIPVGEYRLMIDTEKSHYFRDGGKLKLHLAFRSDDGFSVEEHLEKADGYPVVSGEYKFVFVTDAAGAPVRTVPFRTVDSAFWNQFSETDKAQCLSWYDKYKHPRPDTAVVIEITPEVRGISVDCIVEDDRK